MPYLSRSLVVMICLFLSVSSFARVPARTISSLMESAPSALPKNITKFRTETLSSAYFSTLEELRHALRQNPDWVLSEDFKNIDQELKDWGLSLPTHPEKNASLDEKRYYNDIIWKR